MVQSLDHLSEPPCQWQMELSHMELSQREPSQVEPSQVELSQMELLLTLWL